MTEFTPSGVQLWYLLKVMPASPNAIKDVMNRIHAMVPNKGLFNFLDLNSFSNATYRCVLTKKYDNP
jgi:hypothetical protein